MNFRRTGVHLIATALLLFTSSCSDKVKDTITYTANFPIYMNRNEFIKTVKPGSMQELEKPGKIFLRGNFIFINELYKGIHVIDNSNPANPKNVSFISIPGNVDISAKGNTLYADSFTDLVSIDITDPTQAAEISRVADAFPNVMPPTDNNYPITKLDQTKGIVVGWTQGKITEEINRPVQWVGPMDLVGASFYSKTDASWAGVASGISGQSAVAGSMARFALYNDNLYALTNTQMKIFSISSVQLS